MPPAIVKGIKKNENRREFDVTESDASAKK